MPEVSEVPEPDCLGILRPGHLSGGEAQLPGTDGFHAVAGQHRAWLRGTDDDPLDLSLLFLDEAVDTGIPVYATVAFAEGIDPSETLTFEGVAGWYRWRVSSARSETGTFELCTLMEAL